MGWMSDLGRKEEVDENDSFAQDLPRGTQTCNFLQPLQMIQTLSFQNGRCPLVALSPNLGVGVSIVGFYRREVRIGLEHNVSNTHRQLQRRVSEK